MKKVLIAGFDVFGDNMINPALEAIKRLSNQQLQGAEIRVCKVPVTRYESIDTVVAAIETHQPDVVLSVGLGAGRAAITPERVAINIDDFRIADNNGNQPIDVPIVSDGPDAYFSTLPIKAITVTLQQQGIPCQVSNTAGTFVCNHLFYGVQHYLRGSGIKHGFIHVPLLPDQDTDNSLPTMSLDKIVEGLRLAAQVAVNCDKDSKVGAGQIC